MPPAVIRMARACEGMLGPLARWNATRTLLIWEKAF
jgi:hypothetical protein